jgi:hypothetical protein
MTLVSSRKVAISARGHFLKAALILAPELVHPLGRSLFELRVILVFPGACGGSQSLELAQALEFFLGRLREKSAAAPFADQRVNLGG